MDILKIKELQKILNTKIKNINNKIIKRDRKIDFKEILYGSIYKCINNASYQDVSSKINLDFIKRNIDKTITNTMYNPYIDLIRMAKHPDVNVIKQAGSWITLSLPNLSLEEPIKIQGEGNLATKLKTEQPLFIALRDHVNSLI